MYYYVFNPFYYPPQITVIGNEVSVLKSKFAKVSSQFKQKMSNFPLLEVVGRSGETQFQVGGK